MCKVPVQTIGWGNPCGGKLIIKIYLSNPLLFRELSWSWRRKMLWWVRRGKRPSSSPAKEISGTLDLIQNLLSIWLETFVHLLTKNCRKAITSLQSCARLKGNAEVRTVNGKSIPILNVQSRWGRRMCTRYLEWFLRATLRDCLKYTSSTPTRGFRYFVMWYYDISRGHRCSVFYCFPTQEQVDIMMCEGFSGHQLISQLHDHTVHINAIYIAEDKTPASTSCVTLPC